MLRVLKTAAAIFASWLVTSTAAAQVTIEGEIRVPVRTVFTVNTTVTVPDRGYTYLGGVRTASTSRRESTLEWPSVESRTAALGATAHAWIINLDELDEQIRGGVEMENTTAAKGFGAGIRHYASAPVSAGAGREAAPGSVRRESAGANKLTQHDAGTAQPSEAESALEAQAADLIKRGEDAEARGKLKLAQIYFQTASSLTSAPSAKVARQRLQSLSTKLARL